MQELPTGTVTFLFTDLETSTRLWEELPDAMGVALARHDDILRSAIESHRGVVYSEMGDGMAAVFASAGDAVAAALETQRALVDADWGELGALRARMGLHADEGRFRAPGQYVNRPLNRCARLMAVAHGGQVVVSEAVEHLVRDLLPPDARLVDLGEHRLRDLARPMHVFQLAHPALPDEFPPLRSLDAFPGNLPIERTTLVGRTRERAKISELLEQRRLVTLTGVGGVGKTRLALHVAAETLDRFPDGAWLVPLATIREPDLVPSTVAGVLGIPEQPGRDATAVLVDAIGAQELLLVIDNCEHLLDASARLADALLGGCVNLRVLATSREALGVEGEQSWPTPSLALPESDDATLDELARSAGSRALRRSGARGSARLRAHDGDGSRCRGVVLAPRRNSAGDRARRARASTCSRRTTFSTESTSVFCSSRAAAALHWSATKRCRRPSAGATTFSTTASAGSSIGSRFSPVASRSGRPTPSRHRPIPPRSKRSTYWRAWCTSRWCSPREVERRRDFGRSKRSASSGGNGSPKRARFGRCEIGTPGTTSTFYEALEPGPDDAETVRVEQLEIDNLRSAFDWFAEQGEAAAALRLLVSMGWGSLEAGESFKRRQNTRSASHRSSPRRTAPAPLAMTAYFAFNASDHRHAHELAEAALACAREADIATPWPALSVLGLVAFWRNEPARAIEMFEAGVAEDRRLDDQSARGRARFAFDIGLLCFALGQTGETDRAIALGEEAVEVARGLESPSVLLAQLNQLGLAYQSRDPARAAQLLEESLQYNLGSTAAKQLGSAVLRAGAARESRMPRARCRPSPSASRSPASSVFGASCRPR